MTGIVLPIHKTVENPRKRIGEILLVDSHFADLRLQPIKLNIRILNLPKYFTALQKSREI